MILPNDSRLLRRVLRGVIVRPLRWKVRFRG
jgi:hypothetical protein